MNKRWVRIGAALILSGCGSEEVKQSKFDLAQRRQIEQENAAREAHVRQEQEELARIREQARKRGEATQPAAPREVPLIQPPQTNYLQERPLPNLTPNLRIPRLCLAKQTIYYVGVPAHQIRTVSFGSEKPKATTQRRASLRREPAQRSRYPGSKNVSK